MLTFKGKIIEQHLDSTTMLFNGREVVTRLVGTFNAYNILAIYSAAYLLGAEERRRVLRGSEYANYLYRGVSNTHLPRGYVAVMVMPTHPMPWKTY